MKILAFIGSPRKGGNTDMLVDETLKGSQGSGHVSEKMYLYDYDIAPCIDCRNTYQVSRSIQNNRYHIYYDWGWTWYKHREHDTIWV